jgi:predicted nucleic acid-binding protein
MLGRGYSDFLSVADMDRELMRKGNRLRENDNWIAGFCRYYREPVMSLGGAFDRVPQLRRLAY